MTDDHAAAAGKSATSDDAPEAASFENHPAYPHGISYAGLKTLVAEGVAASRGAKETSLGTEDTMGWWGRLWGPCTVTGAGEGWDYRYDRTGAITASGDVRGIHLYFKPGTKRSVCGVGSDYKTRKLPCRTVSYSEVLAREHPEWFGPPTHFVSHPGNRTPFSTIVMCLQDVVDEFEARDGNPTAFLALDVLVRGRHPDLKMLRGEGVSATIPQTIGSMPGGLIQVSTRWREPKQLQRLFMLWESYCALHAEKPISYALSSDHLSDQEAEMANALRENGPAVILNLVMMLDVDPEKGICKNERDKAVLIADIRRMQRSMQEKTPGLTLLQIRNRLADTIRQSYAGMVERVFRQRWAAAGDVEQLARAMDLGVQVAALWACTDDASGRAELIYRQVLNAMVAEHRQGHDEPVVRRNTNVKCTLRKLEKHLRVARRDKTAAELARMMLLQGRDVTEVRDLVQKALYGHNPCHFEGFSVSFLERFVETHHHDIRYLSTDAVVERLIKPRTSSRWEGDPEKPGSTGQSFFDRIHPDLRQDGPHGAGRKMIFISHAWRQTFHCRDKRRGGIAQAIIESVPEAKRAHTFVWMDVFCVNQHLESPYGGLAAFAFDPLRNAIAKSSECWLMLERWDDPAPLGRVWCLDEIRHAILHGKPVRVCMPRQQKESFRKLMAKLMTLGEQKTKTQAKMQTQTQTQTFTDNHLNAWDEIERVVQRIDIRHASATLPQDRNYVLSQVQRSIGFESLNEFCREIVRGALLDYGQVPQKPWSARLRVHSGMHTVLEKLRERADAIARQREQTHDASRTPVEIEIRRAAALMRIRLEEPTPSTSALAQLGGAVELARRYYGDKAQIVRDMRVILEKEQKHQ